MEGGPWGQQAFDLGVDGLFTDNPDLFRRTPPVAAKPQGTARAEARAAG